MRAVKTANLVICRRTIPADDRRADGGNRSRPEPDRLTFAGSTCEANGNDAYDYSKGTGHPSQGGASAPWRQAREKVVVDFLPAGSAQLRAAKSPASIDAFIGCLRHAGSSPLSTEEIAEIAAQGGQAAVEDHRRNIPVRAAVGDDPDWLRVAAEVLRGAEIVAVTLPTLCEFVWAE